MSLDQTNVHSHRPILETLLATGKIRHVLEFGIGEGSTPLFVEKCESLVSVESNDLEWLERIKALVGYCTNWEQVVALGPCKWMVALPARFPGRTYDLCFVDGHGDSRHAQMLYGFCVAPVVVCHDTETDTFNWAAVYPAARLLGMAAAVHTPDDGGPQTTIWSRQDGDIWNALKVIDKP